MQVAERTRKLAPLERRGFWDQPLAATVPINREVAFYLGLLAVAAALRFWDLGARMIHHDESLHATYSWYLYSGRGYRHDPMMHGPWQFVAPALTYFLFGVSEVTARASHALFGTALVILPVLLRRYLGRTGAAFAALFIALSPSFLYFSRFAREDAYAVTWTMVVAIALIRYLDEQRPFHLYLLAGALSLAFSTKENAYITVGIFLLLLLAYSVAQRGSELLGFLRSLPPTFLPGRRGSEPNGGRGLATLSPQGDLVVALSTLVLPLFTSFLVLPLGLLGVSAANQDGILIVALVGLAAVAYLIGTRWRRELWLRAAAIFWGIFLILHTTSFTNPAGVYTGTIGALRYWIEQQGFARGEQPWYYYLLIVPLYEFVIVAFGLAGVVYWLRQRNPVALFLIWWVVLSQIVYGYTSEKMPWLVVHLALPLALLAGMTVGRLFDQVRWREAWRRGAPLYVVFLLLALVALNALLGQVSAFGPPSPIAFVQPSFAGLALAFMLLAGLGILVVRYGRRLGRVLGTQVTAVTLLGLLMAFSVHTAWQASYYNGDVPVEMLVYTQTTRDVGKVMRQIEDLTFRTGASKETFRVAYDSGVAWPFEWYLRDYQARNFYGSGLPDPDAPIVLASFENATASRVEAFLGDRYVGQRYRLRAWFDESDYRRIGQDPAVLGRAIADPEARGRLWRFLVYREPLRPSGSTDFMVYVRRDLVSG